MKKINEVLHDPKKTELLVQKANQLLLKNKQKNQTDKSKFALWLSVKSTIPLLESEVNHIEYLYGRKKTGKEDWSNLLDKKWDLQDLEYNLQRYFVKLLKKMFGK